MALDYNQQLSFLYRIAESILLHNGIDYKTREFSYAEAEGLLDERFTRALHILWFMSQCDYSNEKLEDLVDATRPESATSLGLAAAAYLRARKLKASRGL